jgi:GNAT superfamily N-acetyltransferase
MQIVLDNNPSPDEIRQIRRGLGAYNVEKVPELLDLPSDEFVVVLRENGQIIGGPVCSFDWGWLYFDNVWMNERERGRGLGRLIVEASESYAAEHGVNNAISSPQAFRPTPSTTPSAIKSLAKIKIDRVAIQQATCSIYRLSHLTHASLSKIHPIVQQSLNWMLDYSFMPPDIPIIHESLAVFLRDEAGALRGGVVGGTFWNWFDLRYFWVDPALRGQNWGKKLLQAVEAEARQRGCIGIACDTTSFQALDFYLKQGFEVFGSLEGRPPNHRSYFIQKRI